MSNSVADEETILSPGGLVSVREAARLLGVGKSTIYSLMGEGELPYVKIRKCRRVQRHALEEYIRHCMVGKGS
jgi:excisionase family DNA binding protein